MKRLPDFLLVRPLHITDYQRGYCRLLSQLTEIGDLSESKFKERLALFLFKISFKLVAALLITF